MMIDTVGEERVLVSRFGEDMVLVAVEDPLFGRISTVRLDVEQAGDLAAALREALSVSRRTDAA